MSNANEKRTFEWTKDRKVWGYAFLISFLVVMFWDIPVFSFGWWIYLATCFGFGFAMGPKPGEKHFWQK